MSTPTSEQVLRQEAIRRRLRGERRVDICRALGRATSWFDKWWAEYRRDPRSDLADRARTPTTSPTRIPAQVEQVIVSVRQWLEAGASAETRYGLIGAPTIRTCLEGRVDEPLPSAPAIQRILARHGLTHPRGAGSDSAYYPWLTAWGVNAIHATDIITRHLRGGAEIQNVHTIDHYSHAVCLTQHADKSSRTLCVHLLASWGDLGLPCLQQFDNEGAFRGGQTHPRILGRVVRLCLWCGIEVLFTPIYEAKRNYQIETFHSLWLQAFWSRQVFTSCAHVQAELPLFLHWYHCHYRPPELEGATPAQMRRATPVVRLTADLRRGLPDPCADRLPLTAGRVHFIRKVDGTGQVSLLNETWWVGQRWVGEYVRATIDTAAQTLSFWHQADATSRWRWLKTRQFRLKETAHEVLPAFRRNRTRCLDCLPS